MEELTATGERLQAELNVARAALRERETQAHQMTEVSPILVPFPFWFRFRPGHSLSAWLGRFCAQDGLREQRFVNTAVLAPCRILFSIPTSNAHTLAQTDHQEITSASFRSCMIGNRLRKTQVHISRVPHPVYRKW